MATLRERWEQVLTRIDEACRKAGRDPGSVHLVAVSKMRSIEEIQALHALGQTRFGENYAQEFLEKCARLDRAALHPAPEWHFIGAMQSNKTRAIAEHADWVHSVDRLKIAERLSAQRPGHLPPLNLCLQVDISLEAGKAGVAETGLFRLAESVVKLPRVRLRGLMTLPAPVSDPQEQRRPFARLHGLLEQLNASGHRLDTLSMGMSDDLEAAVLEGSTLVRIGTAIFGPRTRQRSDT